MARLVLHDDIVVGPAFEEIVELYCEGTDVKEVIISLNVKEFDTNEIARYVPRTKNIAIDLLKVFQQHTLRDHGMMYIPSKWYNLLWTFFHELAHAEQVMDNPALIKFADNGQQLPSMYEFIADENAINDMYQWTLTNPMPLLRNMGWIGQRLQEHINTRFSGYLKIVDEALAAEAGGVMNILNVIDLQDMDDEDKMSYMEFIEEEGKSLRINQDIYITAPVFFGQYEKFRHYAERKHMSASSK
jgi:hypothetical protein